MIESGSPLGRGLVVIIGVVLTASMLLLAAPPMTTTAGELPELVDIRAAHHPGFDRLVFEFEGALPKKAGVRWAKAPLRLDPSHKNARVQGHAFLVARFWPALAHEPAPPQGSTFGPQRRAFGLPNIAHVVLLGDHEGEVTIGVGLMARTRVLRITKLRHPSRLVVDVSTRYPKDRVKVFFADEVAIVDGTPPYVRAVTRKVPRDARTKSALKRLYAGPTAAEAEQGLRFVASGTIGFGGLEINAWGVARVTLRGPCDSGGSALMTVADQVRPTLRSRPAVDWVKIYDRYGQTEEPWGRTDSIPWCLEP